MKRYSKVELKAFLSQRDGYKPVNSEPHSFGNNMPHMNRKPIQEMTEDEKDQAIYSARYILEDYFEEGKGGVEALSERIGVIPGVVHSALENIFGAEI